MDIHTAMLAEKFLCNLMAVVLSDMEYRFPFVTKNQRSRFTPICLHDVVSMFLAGASLLFPRRELY